MLWTIFVILVILWMLGLVSGYTIGGFIHILAGYRNRCGADQSNSGTKTFVNALQRLICPGYIYY